MGQPVSHMDLDELVTAGKYGICSRAIMWRIAALKVRGDRWDSPQNAYEFLMQRKHKEKKKISYERCWELVVDEFMYCKEEQLKLLIRRLWPKGLKNYDSFAFNTKNKNPFTHESPDNFENRLRLISDGDRIPFEEIVEYLIDHSARPGLWFTPSPPNEGKTPKKYPPRVMSKGEKYTAHLVLESLERLPTPNDSNRDIALDAEKLELRPTERDTHSVQKNDSLVDQSLPNTEPGPADSASPQPAEPDSTPQDKPTVSVNDPTPLVRRKITRSALGLTITAAIILLAVAVLPIVLSEKTTPTTERITQKNLESPSDPTSEPPANKPPDESDPIDKYAGFLLEDQFANNALDYKINGDYSVVIAYCSEMSGNLTIGLACYSRRPLILEFPESPTWSSSDGDGGFLTIHQSNSLTAENLHNQDYPKFFHLDQEISGYGFAQSLSMVGRVDQSQIGKELTIVLHSKTAYGEDNRYELGPFTVVDARALIPEKRLPNDQ